MTRNKPSLKAQVLCPECLKTFHVERQMGPHKLMRIMGVIHNCGAILSVDWKAGPVPNVTVDAKPGENARGNYLSDVEDEDE